MIGSLAIAPDLPLGQAGKFVAGAYIVFVVLLLVYVAIMATRAQRLERELIALQRDVEALRDGRDPTAVEPATAAPLTAEPAAEDPAPSGSVL